jgi:succinate dehydrogenase / fumarate reductase cytochrome b subunit
MQQHNIRPVYLNLLKIRFPPTAIASILHRVAGVLLILSLPFLIYLFDLSLRDGQSFSHALQISQHPLISLYLYLLLWAISHHFVAGIRYFLVDLELVSGKCATGLSASIVVMAGILIPAFVYLGTML